VDRSDALAANGPVSSSYEPSICA